MDTNYVSARPILKGYYLSDFSFMVMIQYAASEIVGLGY